MAPKVNTSLVNCILLQALDCEFNHVGKRTRSHVNNYFWYPVSALAETPADKILVGAIVNINMKIIGKATSGR